MHASTVLQSIFSAEATRFALPRELLTTDRVLQRWAVSSGTGLPAEEWDDQPRAKLPQLSDDVAIEVDQCVMSSPRRTRIIIKSWYRTPEPNEVIARKLCISPRNLYTYHSIALNFMRWKFEGSGNAELTRLIYAIDN